MRKSVGPVIALASVLAFGQRAKLPEELRKQLDAIDAAPFLASPKVGLMASPSVGLINVGVTEEKFQRQIELLLRRNGIDVHPVLDKVPNSGQLFVYAGAKPSSQGRYSYSVQVRYHERVLPIRQITEHVKGESTEVGIDGVLWDRDEWGEANAATLEKVISDACEDMLNQFALAYLRANPKH